MQHFTVRTAHGTRLCFVSNENRFGHAEVPAQQAAHLFILSETAVLLIDAVSRGDDQGLQLHFRPLHMRRRAVAGRVSFIDPDNGALLAAEIPHRLISNRSMAGVWEHFDLEVIDDEHRPVWTHQIDLLLGHADSPASIFSRVDDRPGAAETALLRAGLFAYPMAEGERNALMAAHPFATAYLAGVDTGPSDARSAAFASILQTLATPRSMLAALEAQPSQLEANLLTVQFRALVMTERSRAELLGEYPKACAMLASPEDPWTRVALPALAHWKDNRDDRTSPETLGTELDVLAHSGELQRSSGRSLAWSARRHVKPRRGLCAIATARNEGAYIVEWVAHHRLLGIEHFFIYTNDNDDGSDAILDALHRRGEITWLPNAVGPGVSPQFKAYAHAFGISPHTLDYEWALVADLDEFLHIDTSRFRTAGAFIDWVAMQPVDGIVLNWMMYGLHDVVDVDGFAPLVQRLQQRRAGINPHVKGILRPTSFMDCLAHIPISNPAALFRDSEGNEYVPDGQSAISTYPKAESAWLDHYWSKSLPELIAKFSRSRGDNAIGERSMRDIASDIETRVLAEELCEPVLDDRLCVPTQAMAREMERLFGIPGVLEGTIAARSAIMQKAQAFSRGILDGARMDVSPRLINLLQRGLAVWQ